MLFLLRTIVFQFCNGFGSAEGEVHFTCLISAAFLPLYFLPSGNVIWNSFLGFLVVFSGVLKLVLKLLLLNDCFWSFVELPVYFIGTASISWTKTELKNVLIWFLSFLQRGKMEVVWFLLCPNPVKVPKTIKENKNPNKPWPGAGSSWKFAVQEARLWTSELSVFVAWK